MMSTRSRSASKVVGLVMVLNAVTMNGQSTGSAPVPPLDMLGVPGASNSTPSLTATGQTVAAVWTAAKDGITNLYFAISNDGGTTFSAPRRVNDQDGDAGATPEQPPRVVISGSGKAQTITVLWSKRDPGPQQTRRDVVRVARSTDGGRTFSPARFLHDPAFAGARGWQSLTLGPDGTVHAVWLDGRNAARHIAESAKKTGMEHKGQPPQEIFYAKLGPDGPAVETRIASDVCFCCKTAVAVDTRGAVYTAWRHIFPGSIRDIAFAKSIDGGRGFSPIVRVSNDNWELNGCPEDGPSLAVDQSGTIHIAWATVVNDGEPQKAVFYATSRDGQVFSPRKRVPTTGTTTPGHPQLLVNSDGSVVIAFDEVAGGRRQVSLTRLSQSGVFAPAQILSGDESAMHPVFVRLGTRNLLVAWTSRPSTGGSSAPSQIRLKRVTVG